MIAVRDRVDELDQLALIFVDNGMLRLTTRNMLLIAALQRGLTYMHQQMVRERGKNRFLFEATPCYDLTKTDGAINFVAGVGFLPRIVEICQGAQVACELYEYDAQRLPQPLASPELLPPLELHIPKVDWNSMRTWQQDALRYMRVYRSARFGVPTGDGKTTLIARFCRFAYKSRILVVTRSVDPILGLYHAAVAEGVGASLDTSRKRVDARGPHRVMFTTTGKLNAHLEDDYDILIGDEIHEHAVADAVTPVLSAKCPRRFGFSGNADKRNDNAQMWLEGLYGPLMIKRIYDDALSDGNVVPIYYRALATGYRGKGTNSNHPSVREQVYIWRNVERNALFAKVGYYYLGQGRRVLALVKTTEHALAFRKFFDAPIVVGQIDPEREDYFVSQGLLRRGEAEKLIYDGYETLQRFCAGEVKAVIAGPMWHKAVDIPALDVVLRMDATQSIVGNTQIPGRLARRSPGKKYGLLVDGMDEFHSTFNNKWAARRAFYHKQNWRPIEELEG